MARSDAIGIDSVDHRHFSRLIQHLAPAEACREVIAWPINSKARKEEMLRFRYPKQRRKLEWRNIAAISSSMVGQDQ
jgi:hypothetical protein